MASDRTALILGASGALGGALAARLARDGYRLGLHAHRHPERCPEIETAVRYSADLLQAEQISPLIKRFAQEFGRMDALVWAVSRTSDDRVGELTDEEFTDLLTLQLRTPLLVAKAAARIFLKQRSGSFLLLCPPAALRGARTGAAHAASQSGLVAAVRSLAREWGASGVRVNALVPPVVAPSNAAEAVSPNWVEQARHSAVLVSGADPMIALTESASMILGDATASGQIFTIDSRIS